MHILLTNGFVRGRSGSEEVIRDYVGYFLRRQHRVSVYAPVVVEAAAAEYRSRGVEIADDLRAFADRPDLIHGHHVTAFLPAMERFPGVPVVQWIHGLFGSWDMTVTHPDVAFHVGVDAFRAERAIQGGADPARVAIIPNSVDVDRFPLRPIDPALRKALFVTKGGDDLAAVARACAATGWELEVVGSGVGREVHDLETVMARSTLVISTGRSLMEAIAMGRSALVADWRCLGGQVTRANWDAYRAGNLALPATWRPFDEAAFTVELARVDLAEGLRLGIAVRDTLRIEHGGGAAEALYARIVRDHRPAEGVAGWTRDLVRFLEGCPKFQPGWRPSEADRVAARRGTPPG